MMTGQSDDSILRERIASLLRTQSAGSRVSREMRDRYAKWQDRVLIADLRARRIRYGYKHALDVPEAGDDRGERPKRLN